jgi:hypothetical protein
MVASMIAWRLLGVRRRTCDIEDDRMACAMGVDCAEGALEFYSKEIERNLLLRGVLVDGERLIDERGDWQAREWRVPFTSYGFVVDEWLVGGRGKRLADRREFCKRELLSAVARMIAAKKKMEEDASAAIQVPVELTGDYEDKEWPIFKKMASLLEGPPDKKKS